ncbi:MAG: methyltransferase domain-containing protein [Acidobacteria bacterium]|nr:methyltransferase domain-containing protein [Acidobacteriota bacterium]
MSASPEKIFGMMQAHVQTAALKGGIDLGLFTAIGEGNTTVPAIAARCGASERGIRILCDYLAIAGLLTKENGSYGLSPDAAAFLDRRSRMYMGGAVAFMNHAMHFNAAANVAETVRTGTTILNGREYLDIENHVWVEFAKGMAPMMFPAAQYMAAQLESPRRLLDIAAGHGIFGVVAAARYPELHIDALDWPAVLTVAAENAQGFGVADRWHATPGNALEMEFATGYDAVYLTNFLHHFDAAECTKILAKCRAALRPGGILATLEFVPNPDRVTPIACAAFSMTMLLNTPAGDAYTMAELEAMLHSAGFASNVLHDVPNSPERLLISR